MFGLPNDRPVRAIPLLAVCVLAFGATRADAFDHVRKGFVLGLGAGATPYAALSTKDNPAFGAPVDDSGPGFGYQLVIGYAFNDRNWIVYEGNVLARSPKVYDTTFFQGFNGASWYHEFGERGHSWVTAVGAGAQVASVSDYICISFSPSDPPCPAGPPNDLGFGGLLGVGYEFAPRWFVMAYGSAGTTKDSSDEFSQSHVSLLLHYLWD